ncbi:hypothetical protein [Kitasatospora sp. NPDC058218]|uniref:hypothetical protein n=1 Tax=Kitasatospora sp. NPDC058218 TaxID=3346385 RepID=UPI0036DDA39C
MAQLPSDAEMSKLFALGVSDRDIADKYGVTTQAVSWRWKKLGLQRNAIIDEVSELVGSVWSVVSHPGAGSHHKTSKAQSLRYYLRVRLGDKELSDRNLATAASFEKTMRRRGHVLDYSREDGFFFVPRTPDDEDFIIRWPRDKVRPVGEESDIWRLPGGLGPRSGEPR